jgi:LysM repeat protein
MSKTAIFLPMCALLLLGGCVSTLTALKTHQNSHIEEMRTEIADLKHALHGTEVEVKLLEERLESQESQASNWISDDLALLQKKITILEKSFDKLNHEIRSLSTYANQTTSSLSQYRDQIIELDQKMHAISEKRSNSLPRKYLVKSGDSLGKIAQQYGVSLDALKQENQLLSDKILIGQQLRIPLE